MKCFLNPSSISLSSKNAAFCTPSHFSPSSSHLKPYGNNEKKNIRVLFATTPDFSGWENSISEGGRAVSAAVAKAATSSSVVTRSDNSDRLDSFLMSDILDGGVAVTTPTTTFEPVVNVPSLISFLIIAIVFTLLQIRINAVSTAAERRTLALTELRKLKSLQLSSNTIVEGETEDEETENNINTRVRNALTEYEAALTEEMNLRSIAPGIRIAAPNDPQKMEEDIAAAKQFLGWDLLQEEDDEERTKKDGTSNNPLSKQSSSAAAEESPMSNASIALLGFTGIVLALLLFVLQFDPMTANNVFTNVEGGMEPPMDMPLRSW